MSGERRVLRTPAGAELARTLHARPALGVAAHVMQGEGLEIVRIRVERPALILVDRGFKTVKPERGAAVRAMPGQALLLAGGQTVDFHNRITDGERYEARWLMFGGVVLDDPYYLATAERLHTGKAAMPRAQALRRVPPGLADAFERARRALAPDPSLPDTVVRQQLLEVAHWLLAQGLVLRAPMEDARISGRIRAMLSARPEDDWSAAAIARALAMSEATLRRRLAAEGASLRELIADVRMASALVLLQATSRPVSEIASAVGYDSPSRFAVRFRDRFGFAPTAVRGHARGM
ncbi:MAG: helix-turn-helix transcriptional regulator [Mitsuaria chitosanitabida]|uniref:helix-turn-helix transcriptional regulator n=1 Tax=Roseateles chitosanitabidus TaxID=65048 RepID=UPI001B04BC23|nr:helix-turn-helix transcriptional regulator [Roseateles chitosanitabidus]MBO9689152.1 helix-turn-helix transcriptional regulator [Roseateles chitosanitabidus]